MRAYGHTTTWGLHVGTEGRVKGLDWLQRLRRWFASHPTSHGHKIPERVYASWDAKREQYRPPIAESAMELAAAQGGQSLAIIIYVASL